MTTRSPAFPTSMEPRLPDMPREKAALMVDAASASGMLMCRRTHARCMTMGCMYMHANTHANKVTNRGYPAYYPAYTTHHGQAIRIGVKITSQSHAHT